MQTIQQAIKQLERSERGQKAAKLLLDLLDSSTVKYLDGSNFQALTTLTAHYALGSGADSCEVIEGLQGIVDRNKWVLV